MENILFISLILGIAGIGGAFIGWFLYQAGEPNV